jgi:hypothetical protein
MLVLPEDGMHSILGVAMVIAAPPSSSLVWQLPPLAVREERAPAGAFGPVPTLPPAGAIAPTEWYGWQTVAVDLFSMALGGSGLALHSGALLGLGLTTYSFGAPTVHLVRGETRRGVASVTLRVGLPLVAGLAGAGIGARGESSTCRDTCGIPTLYGGLTGAAAGALMAVLTDLAWSSAPPIEEAPGADWNGHWFLGAGGSLLVYQQDGGGPGFSLEAQYQALHWGMGVSAFQGTLGHGSCPGCPSYDDAKVTSALALGTRVFGDGGVGPYLGAGAGYLRETGGSPVGPTTPGAGAAALAEAGVLLWRNRSWGRAALALRATVPLFAERPPVYTCPTCPRSGGSPSFTFGSLSLRIFL